MQLNLDFYSRFIRLKTSSESHNVTGIVGLEFPVWILNANTCLLAYDRQTFNWETFRVRIHGIRILNINHRAHSPWHCGERKSHKKKRKVAVAAHLAFDIEISDKLTLRQQTGVAPRSDDWDNLYPRALLQEPAS